MNHFLKSIYTVFCFVLLFTNSTLLFGQIAFSTQSVESDSSIYNRIDPIPINQVPAKIEETEIDIKIGEKKVAEKNSITKIDSLLPEYVAFLNKSKKDARVFIKANPNRQKINNLIGKWDGYYNHLDSWQNTINNSQDDNYDFALPVKQNEILWSKTYDLAVSQQAPPSILNSIKRTLKDIKKIKKAVIKENNKLLTLETEIIKYKGEITETIDDLIYLKNSNIYNIFYRRHDPFWNANLLSSESSAKDSQGVESVSDNFKTTKYFFTNGIEEIVKYFLIVGLIIFLFVIFNRSFKDSKFNEEDARLQQAKSIIVDYTTPSIVFLSGIIALFYFNDIPFLLRNVIFLIPLFASIPIAQSVLYNKYNKIPYLIILFHIVNTVKTFVWFSAINYRIYNLFEAILVIIIILYFTHPYKKLKETKSNKLGKIIIYFIPFLYLLLSISIISNLLGYTNLTDLTLKISTQGSILILVFYTLYMVLSGLLIGALHLFFTKQKNYNEDRKMYVEKRSLQFLSSAIFIWWFFYFLGLLDLKASFIQWIQEWLYQVHTFGTSSFTYGEIFTFIIVLVASFLITNFISMIIDGGALDFLKLPKGIPAAISLVVRYFILIFGFILALAALGIDMSNFNLMAGALGLGIGFGLQTIISNFISGIILIFERPILVGDTVEVQNLLGKVTDIGVRASRVRTYDGAEVIVPNNNLIANDLINWTLSDSIKRIEIKIGTAYGSDPNIVLEILKEEAIKNEYSLKEPEPGVLFDQFGDSSLDFRLLVWVPYDKGLTAKSEISIAIYNSFAEHGIKIPFPQQDVYIKETSDKIFTDELIPFKEVKQKPSPTKKESKEGDSKDKA